MARLAECMPRNGLDMKALNASHYYSPSEFPSKFVYKSL